MHRPNIRAGTRRPCAARYPVTDLNRKHVDFRAAEKETKERHATRRQEGRRTRAEGSRSNSTEESEDKNKRRKREKRRRREQRDKQRKIAGQGSKRGERPRAMRAKGKMKHIKGQQ